MSDIHCLIHSEAGEGHANEDVALVRPHPDDAGVLLCALADGQGGQAGGADAARIAAEESLRVASSFPAKELFGAAPWYAVVGAADEAVCEGDGMRTAGDCRTTSASLCCTGKQRRKRMDRR